MSATTKPEAVFSRGPQVNAKAGSDRYSEKRYVGRHHKTGLEVPNPFAGGRPTEQPSERDFALAGVLFKHLAAKSGLVPVSLTDHERGMIDELGTSHAWAGTVNGTYLPVLTQVKALLDDPGSGGLEISPIFFDNMVVTYPLLSGEVFPSVQVVDIPRGRRIESGGIMTPTLTWGTADGTEIDLFNTANLVTAIDTTIHPVTVAIEIGRDFLSDAAVNVGDTLTRLVGERLAAELDKVIMNGNGTTQPEGIFNASGIGSVTTENGAGGPPTLADYLTLMFSTGKQYRSPSNRCAFISNDTTYQRSRSIKIDTASPSTDQRPVFGLEAVNSYMTVDWPHRINNDLANTRCAFGALSKYRMYRRTGLELRFESGGKELARKNLVLLVARARFGGQVTDGDAFAIWTSGQS
jgi:HK97 family phage major capsid protein